MADFDRFTERLRKVLSLAQEESIRLHHTHIDTAHLLLGLIREGDGVGAQVLGNMGVPLPKVRSAVEFILGRGTDEVIGEIGLTLRAKKAIELTVDESRRLNHSHIGTEHLLLGLLREGGLSAGILQSLGISLDRLRAQVLQVVNGSAEFDKSSWLTQDNVSDLVSAIVGHVPVSVHLLIAHGDVEPLPVLQTALAGMGSTLQGRLVLHPGLLELAVSYSRLIAEAHAQRVGPCEDLSRIFRMAWGYLQTTKHVEGKNACPRCNAYLNFYRQIVGAPLALMESSIEEVIAKVAATSSEFTKVTQMVSDSDKTPESPTQQPGETPVDQVVSVFSPPRRRKKTSPPGQTGEGGSN